MEVVFIETYSVGSPDQNPLPQTLSGCEGNIALTTAAKALFPKALHSCFQMISIGYTY